MPFAAELGGWDSHDEHWRARDMTAEKLRADCREAGLVCVHQEIIPWGKQQRMIDAYSLIARPRPGQVLEERVERNEGYWGHVWERIRVAERYARPG